MDFRKITGFPMCDERLRGINGILRGHIAKIGVAYGGRVILPRRVIADDDRVRDLLRSGLITEQHLQDMLKAYNLFPGNIAWLTDLDDAVLVRADAVFLARYGRDPARHTDFRGNGRYHEICENLIRDWNHYDGDLRKLCSDSQGKAVSSDVVEAPPPSVKLARISDVTAWAVLVAIVLGLLAFYAANRTGDGSLIALSAMGLVVASVASVCVFPPYRCPRCRMKYGKRIPPTCSRCGVRLQSANETSRAVSGHPGLVVLEDDSVAF